MIYKICNVKVDPLDYIPIKISYNLEESTQQDNILLKIIEKDKNDEKIDTSDHYSDVSETNLNDGSKIIVTILVVFHTFYFGSEHNSTTVATNMLLLDSKIPFFSLESSENFKYKKHIRNILDDTFKIRSKDISGIKHVNNLGSYHNYIVILKDNNRAKSSFNYNIRSKAKDKFLWRTVYSIISGEKSTNISIIFKYLHDFYKDDLLNKSIPINHHYCLRFSDIFSSLSDFTSD